MRNPREVVSDAIEQVINRYQAAMSLSDPYEQSRALAHLYNDVGQAAVGLGHTAVTVSKTGVVVFEAAASRAFTGPLAGSRAAQRGAVFISIPTREKVGPGQHVRANDSMDLKAEAYQMQVAGTGKTEAYHYNGVNFDGYDNGVLVEAKHGYEGFIKNGEFISWWAEGGLKKIIDQARRQYIAADGYPIQWRFSSEKVANIFKKIFEKEGFEIEIAHIPVKETK